MSANVKVLERLITQRLLPEGKRSNNSKIPKLNTLHSNLRLTFSYLFCPASPRSLHFLLEKQR